MIRLILLVAALVAGAIVGPQIAGNQGYVLISFANQTLEMSLTTMMILLVVLLAAFFLVENIIKLLFSTFRRTRSWVKGRKKEKARTLTATGQTKLLEGDWIQAEKLALKGASHSDAPQLNYLTAAEAAQSRGEIALRDKHLAAAEKSDKNSLAVNLTRARLQFENKQYEEALAALQLLQRQQGNNPVILNLLRHCYLALGDWQPLLKLLPALKKARLIQDEEYQALYIKAECGLMEHITAQRGSEGLLSHWHNLNKQTRQTAAILRCFTELMVSHQADNQAYSILKEQLKKSVSDSTLRLLPLLNLADYHPVIVKLQSLQSHNAENAVLFSTLGQLYLRDSKPAEAKQQFEKAITLAPCVTDFAFLADILEQLEQPEEAASVAKQGLNLALPS
ncbi:heme biosynthesis HemY N-terminal domain-containing protein [Thaumasiovibrio sp. DFM-14]|uniref:heme biosynthesis HemY N-terminal domain-containing protein n=1 Tax=Thaumasiovibrio sp. DFM-14 TaxID=3384792 RepID=UPI00399F7AAD